MRSRDSDQADFDSRYAEAGDTMTITLAILAHSDELVGSPSEGRSSGSGIRRLAREDSSDLGSSTGDTPRSTEVDIGAAVDLSAVRRFEHEPTTTKHIKQQADGVNENSAQEEEKP